MPSNPRALSVLVVDDEEDSRLVITHIVQAEGCRVRTASSLEQALNLLAESPPDVVITDLLLDDGRGTELLQKLQASPDTEVIIITGQATVDSAVEALRLGA